MKKVAILRLESVPKRCNECPMANIATIMLGTIICQITKEKIPFDNNGRLETCPLVIQEEKAQTNFEKWKDELTFEYLGALFGSSGSCGLCPIGAEKCFSTRKRCEILLEEWAESEVEQ